MCTTILKSKCLIELLWNWSCNFSEFEANGQVIRKRYCNIIRYIWTALMQYGCSANGRNTANTLYRGWNTERVITLFCQIQSYTKSNFYLATSFYHYDNSDDYTKFDFHNHYLTDEQKKLRVHLYCKKIQELIGSLSVTDCSKNVNAHWLH